MEPSIRLAAKTDLAAIVDIYNQAVSLKFATADISSVTLESRQSWFKDHAPEHYPIYVAEYNESVVGWCSLSPYRPGRMALRHTAEISYYIDKRHRGIGVATSLISRAIDNCPRLGLKTLFAIILDKNQSSTKILRKFGFQQWGHMPNIADFDGEECGHLYFGIRLV